MLRKKYIFIHQFRKRLLHLSKRNSFYDCCLVRHLILLIRHSKDRTFIYLIAHLILLYCFLLLWGNSQQNQSVLVKCQWQLLLQLKMCVFLLFLHFQSKTASSCLILYWKWSTCFFFSLLSSDYFIEAVPIIFLFGWSYFTDWNWFCNHLNYEFTSTILGKQFHLSNFCGK